jgi:hypothetical protein
MSSVIAEGAILKRDLYYCDFKQAKMGTKISKTEGSNNEVALYKLKGKRSGN